MTAPRYTEPIETSSHSAVPRRGGDKTYVYLASDELGRLLYVGITSDVYRRMGQHAVASPWYDKMAHVATELYATRRQAAKREQQLVERHDPPHNTMLKKRAEAQRNMRRVAEAKAKRVPSLIR